MPVLMGALLGFAVGWNMVLCGMLIFRRGPYGCFRNRRLVVFLMTLLRATVGGALILCLMAQLTMMFTMPLPVASASLVAAIAGAFALSRFRRLFFSS